MNILDVPCDGCGDQISPYAGMTYGRLPDGRTVTVHCNGGICWNLAKNATMQLELFA